MRTESETRMGWPSIAIVWAIATMGAIAVVVLAYAGSQEWIGDAGRLGPYGALGMVLGASVVVTLAVQLATRRPVGFVMRTSASVAGAVVVVGLAAALVAPVALG